MNGLRIGAIFLVATVAILGLPSVARADLIYESASLGSTGHSGGSALSEQYLGTRFTLTETTQITHVGGHMVGSPAGSTFWGAIIDLGSSSSALPTFGSDPIASHALAYAVMPTTGTTSSEITAALTAPVILGPGQYGLIFGGGGAYGTTASGSMPGPTYTGAVDLPGASYFFRQSYGGNTWYNGGFSGVRFTVYGGAAVPEPATLALFGVALVGAVVFRRRRKTV